MITMKFARILGAVCLLLAAAVSASAATPFTLTCTPMGSGNPAFTIPLTGFNFTITSAGTEGANPRFAPPEFSIQFVPSVVYGELYKLAALNVEISKCEVADTEGQGVTGRDSWTQSTAPKGSNPRGNNAPEAAGPIQWTFEQVAVTQVTVTESENNAGVPVGAITAKFRANRVSVSPQ